MFKQVSKLTSLFAVLFLAFGLSWSGIQKAASQQDDAPKQTLVVQYPFSGISLNGKGGPLYTGLVYVKIYPVSPALIRKYGAGPIASAELSARQRDVRTLPLGEYEVHFAVRSGGELKTYILRDVILRADRANAIAVEMNNEAKTTIVGGDMTAQEMADSIRQLQQEVARLKQK